MRTISILILGLLAGCASYVTPGGPANLDAINRADIAEVASRKPASSFPARIAIARVQASNYRSYSAAPMVTGRYSVITTQELLTDAALARVTAWPKVVAAPSINRLLLPAKVETIEDLRVAGAKLQADVLLVYTLDTSFRVQGRGVGPLSVVSLGLIPDRDAYISTTASAVFADVRTGYIYGVAEFSAKASGLTNAWGSREVIDRKRIEAEKEAFAGLINEAGNTWAGIVSQYGVPVQTQALR